MPVSDMSSTMKIEPKNTKKEEHARSHVREGIETIVFVVTLVLMLKLFTVEAFVIPTGSMAETLYGIQKIINCPECGYEFPVNSNSEEEPDEFGRFYPLYGYCCPNCRYKGTLGEDHRPRNNSGDRVLVLKPIYQAEPPQRGDVVVFKFPKTPVKFGYTSQNYIKRAMGFGGETLAIFRGELFTTRALSYSTPEDSDGRPVDPLDLWKIDYTFRNSPPARDLFFKTWEDNFPSDAKFFQIVRKTDDQVLACRRIVWDNNHQPQSLRGKTPPRWHSSGDGWRLDDPAEPRIFTHSGQQLDWLHYQHFSDVWSRPTKDFEPDVIRNFLAYNAGDYGPFGPMRERPVDNAWVGDLILECEVDLSPEAEVTLELSRSLYRYRATFVDGQVTLSQIGPDSRTLVQRPTNMRRGKHHIRFANVDARLRVWINERAMDFGAEADLNPVMPKADDLPAGMTNGKEGWTKANDLEHPASIGCKGQATIRNISLWRDIYYCNLNGTLDPDNPEIFYVQPGHYFCLGDNSAQSSDSRDWGAVPERLLLGKAVFVFWPASLNKNRNRFGVIK